MLQQRMAGCYAWILLSDFAMAVLYGVLGGTCSVFLALLILCCLWLGIYLRSMLHDANYVAWYYCHYIVVSSLRSLQLLLLFLPLSVPL